MSKPEILTFMSVVQLLNLKGAYMIGYSWLFGMSIWVTFFGGVIAFKALPRQQFGTLQHKVFPVYFVVSIALSSALLTLWAVGHTQVLTRLTKLHDSDVVQTYTLACVLLFNGANHFIVSPMTSKTMFERHRLEKAEGKSYDEEGVSAEMKALNKKFAQLHGASSLANLYSVIALVFHGIWIGNYGLGSL